MTGPAQPPPRQLGIPWLPPLLLAVSTGIGGCAGATASQEPWDPAPDQAPLLTSPDGGAPLPAPDQGLAADGSPPATKGCGAAPLPLGRFPRSLRSTPSGRVFGGWGGSAVGGKASRAPVVLVPGNGATADAFLGLRKDLCQLGYTDDEIWAVTFQDRSCFGLCVSGSNVQHADELQRFVQLVRAQTGASRVALVAVSMGVTTARHYMKFRGGLQRSEVALAYLVSGPNHGAASCDIAGAAAVNVACAELSSATLLSGWLHDLNSPDETPAGQGDVKAAVFYRTVRYALDPSFPGLYAASPRLEGADNLVIQTAGHDAVPFTDLRGYLLAKLP